MSKFDITGLDDRLITPEILSPMVDKFYELTKEMPESIVLRAEQWSKFFMQAGEPMTNFRGIPLSMPETSENSTQKQNAIKTIDIILSHMHKADPTSVSDIYKYLEEVKERLGVTSE